MLQIPFTAHRFLPGRIPFRIQQAPNPSARRARTLPRIVPSETAVQIVSPADISSRPASTPTTQNVDEALHDWLGVWFFLCARGRCLPREEER
jgi:hypothetical protein